MGKESVFRDKDVCINMNKIFSFRFMFYEFALFYTRLLFVLCVSRCVLVSCHVISLSKLF